MDCPLSTCPAAMEVRPVSLCWGGALKKSEADGSTIESAVLKHRIVLMGENGKKRYTEDDSCLAAYWTNVQAFQMCGQYTYIFLQEALSFCYI